MNELLKYPQLRQHFRNDLNCIEQGIKQRQYGASDIKMQKRINARLDETKCEKKEVKHRLPQVRACCNNVLYVHVN